MNQAILVEGKEYISAIRASEKSDYTSDYIGQLCRAKKIPGKLIGKTWYIDFRALLEYKNRRKPRGGVEKAGGSMHTAEVRKIVLPGHLSYESEVFSSLPLLSKKGPYIQSALAPGFILDSVKLTFILIFSLSFMFIILQDSAPAVANKIEQNTQFLSQIMPEFYLFASPQSVSLEIAPISLLGSVIQAGDTLTQSWISLKQATLNRFVTFSY